MSGLRINPTHAFIFLYRHVIRLPQTEKAGPFLNLPRSLKIEYIFFQSYLRGSRRFGGSVIESSAMPGKAESVVGKGQKQRSGKSGGR